MRTLVTGAAGFIGYHVAQRLLAQGGQVVGIDNLNPYYDPRLKRERLRLRAFCGLVSRLLPQEENHEYGANRRARAVLHSS
jgi:nucleoside-diphosphate-sugar epimerase